MSKQYLVYAVYSPGKKQLVSIASSPVSARLIALMRSTEHPLHCIVVYTEEAAVAIAHCRNGRFVATPSSPN